MLSVFQDRKFCVYLCHTVFFFGKNVAFFYFTLKIKKQILKEKIVRVLMIKVL